jgi:glycosyltransferase involved in cell wall biosynthesis
LLFLAWDFPPAQSIGSVRTWNIAKHLTRRGWDVTVVTPEPRLIRYLENPETTKARLLTEGIRQILTDHRWRFLVPDRLTCWNRGPGWFWGGICRRIARRIGLSSAFGWTKAAERACGKLGPEDVDLILASGPPFSAFVLAERLSKKLERPYVLDYRDPWWTEIPTMFQGLRWIVERLESRLLSGAAAVINVSPSWAADLQSQFKFASRSHVITNGYDPEELRDVRPHHFGHFAIVYAGIFYPPERVVTPVLAAMKRLEMKGKPIEYYFHYYGNDGDHVREEAVRLGIADRVKLHGMVPRSEALSAVKGANIAVVIASVFEEASRGINGWIPAKLFETIGLGTPMLLIAPPGSDVETIAEPTGLARQFTGADTEGIVSFIEHVMAGESFTQRDVDSITWTHIAGRLDYILRQELARFQFVQSPVDRLDKNKARGIHSGDSARVEHGKPQNT